MTRYLLKRIRLLQRKGKIEVEQAQHKFNEINNILNSSLDVQNQLHSQTIINNIKVLYLFSKINMSAIKLTYRLIWYRHKLLIYHYSIIIYFLPS